MDKIKVVCIVGDGRCGSTILDRVLGAGSGVVSCNELYRIFHRSEHEEGRCTCSEKPKECSFWKDIFNQIESKGYDLKALGNVQFKKNKNKYYIKHYLSIKPDEQEKELISSSGELYKEIGKKTNNAIIVDSSKGPVHPLILSRCKNIDVDIVHLIRNPKDVMESWRKSKYDPGYNKKMKTFGAYRVCLVWAARQILSELLKFKFNYIAIRYEDFVENPNNVLQEIEGKISCLKGRIKYLNDDNTISLPALHTLSGNPDRFSHGVTKIKKTNKPDSPKAYFYDRIWLFLIKPLSKRYGY